MGLRIMIVCARTWGQLGNFIAANKLGAALEESLPDAEIIIQPFEEYCRFFAQSGERIRAIYSSGETPAERNALYAQFLGEIGRRFGPRFEFDPAVTVEGVDLKSIAERISARNCDVVFGLKGLISRICWTAINRHALKKPPVINYVTNDGLLTLDAHHSHAPILHMVQTQYGRRRLQDTLRQAPGAQVDVVGPLVKNRVRPALPRPAKQAPKPSVGVLVNRGGQEYASLLQRLSDMGDLIKAELIFVASEDLSRQAKALATERNLDWTIDDALPHELYQQRLAALAEKPASLMVCKTAPNTVFEALSFGLPVVGLQSGLPMEDWIGTLIDQEKVGMSTTDVATAGDYIKTWAASLDEAEALRRRVTEFSNTFFNYHRTRSVIADRLTETALLSPGQ